MDAMLGYDAEKHGPLCGGLWTMGLYDCVAAVDTPSLDAAYERTNTIHSPWYTAPGLPVSAQAALGCRSTSVGDVLLTSDGRLYAVASMGFTDITDGVLNLASLNGACLREQGQQPLDAALQPLMSRDQRRLLHATSVPVHPDCEQGLHSWIHETSKLDPDYECSRCTEPYGNPE